MISKQSLKIAVNSIYDLIRRKNIEQAFTEFASSMANQSDSTWQEVVFNDMLAQIHELMQQMPEQRRKIFQLSKESGLNNDEIAKNLGLSKRTVENQLYRATAFLKSKIKPDTLFLSLLLHLFLS
ncbi:sigma-70 family RNA polymerase sigma factor [Gaoshiqia sp. Z1-71]|uniref:sigma-70 family RNA polymerase sigma factor n=1 Tax=Gaoshiqia hydrogeniformans TaxID=3290090 RepID=UPI003BF8F544